MKDIKGSASVDIVIMVTLLLVFVIMPIFFMGLEKLIIAHSLNTVVETMESCLYDSVTTIDMSTLSETTIHYNSDNLRDDFEQEVKKRLGTLVTVETKELLYYPSVGGVLPCTPSKEMHYDTLHVSLKVVYAPQFYGHIIKKETNQEIQFHFDLELPKNR